MLQEIDRFGRTPASLQRLPHQQSHNSSQLRLVRKELSCATITLLIQLAAHREVDLHLAQGAAFNVIKLVILLATVQMHKQHRLLGARLRLEETIEEAFNAILVVNLDTLLLVVRRRHVIFVVCVVMSLESVRTGLVCSNEQDNGKRFITCTDNESVLSMLRPPQQLFYTC